MSLILDALKKLEQDKAARRNKGLDLGPAILTGASRRPAPRGRLIAIVAIGAVVVGITAYWIKGTPGPRKNPETSLAGTPTPPAATAPPAIPTPATTQPAPTPTAPVQPLPAATPPQAPVATGEPAAPPAKASPPRTATPSRPVAEKVPTVPPPANIKVTGIAWSDERGSRRAVVNGALLGEGNEVAGATITEIRQNLVRFSQNGQVFEITINTPFPGKETTPVTR